MHVSVCHTKRNNSYLPRCALPTLAYYNVETRKDLDALYPDMNGLEGVMLHCADLDHRQIKMLDRSQALHTIMLGDGMWVSRVKLGVKGDYPVKFASYSTKEEKKWRVYIDGEKDYSLGDKLKSLLD